VSASFNHTANWTLQIRNSSGTLVRSYSGSGTNMSQVWNGRNASNNLVANGTYTLTVTATDAGGSVASGSTQVTKDSTAPSVSGFGDSPDPFRPSTGQSTTISYTISEPATVSLRVYNSGGTLVRTLVSDVFQTTLANQVVWNGRNDSNVIVPAGTYTYKLWVEDRALNRNSPYPASGNVRVR
jgi:flagellar hook assembly protein FlgD